VTPAAIESLAYSFPDAKYVNRNHAKEVCIPGRSLSNARVERYDHAFAVVQLDVDFAAFVRGHRPSGFQRRPSAAPQRPLRDLPGIELDYECVGSPHAPQRSSAIAADDVPANSPGHLFPIHRKRLCRGSYLARAAAPSENAPAAALRYIHPKSVEEITGMGIAPKSFLDLQSEPVHAS
jgi:hypothetical protein